MASKDCPKQAIQRKVSDYRLLPPGEAPLKFLSYCSICLPALPAQGQGKQAAALIYNDDFSESLCYEAKAPTLHMMDRAHSSVEQSPA